MANKTITILSFSPAVYQKTIDCARVGLGIQEYLLSFKDKYNLPLTVNYYDGVKLIDNPSKAIEVIESSDCLVLGGSTWGEGPTPHVRKFFELGGDVLAVKATAYATAGGYHTGGEEVISSILRSLMGIGCDVFTFFGKYMVWCLVLFIVLGIYNASSARR